MTSKPCFRCYQLSHSTRERCPNNGLISCTRCFRANVFTNGCNCLDKKQPEPCQVLRFIGNPKSPRWFTDLKIHDQIVPAMINTSITRCRVSVTFAKWWNSYNSSNKTNDQTMILLAITRKERQIQIPCDVINNLEENIHIEIGTELMTFLKYTFTMENITIIRLLFRIHMKWNIYTTFQDTVKIFRTTYYDNVIS